MLKAQHHPCLLTQAGSLNMIGVSLNWALPPAVPAQEPVALPGQPGQLMAAFLTLLMGVFCFSGFGSSQEAPIVLSVSTQGFLQDQSRLS